MFEEFGARAILLSAFFLGAVLLPVVAPCLIDGVLTLISRRTPLPLVIALGATVAIGGSGYFIWDYGVSNSLRFSSLAELPQTLRTATRAVLPYSLAVGVFACIVRVVKRY